MRSALAIGLMGLMLAPTLAQAVAPSAKAQGVISGTPVTQADLQSALASANTYTNSQVGSLSTDANVTTFATRMADLGLLTTPAMAALAAPVKSVNSLTGNVTLTTYLRQVNATPITWNGTTGNATFTFDTAFTNLPSCYVEINATNTNYVFSQPVTVSKTTTGVTMNVQAALKLLNISLGALTVWGPPPSGTTANFFCLAPN